MIFRRQPHRQQVFLIAEMQIRRQIECKSDVAIRTRAQLMPVQPDVRVRHSAVKLDAEVAVFDVIGQGERLAVPSRSEDRQRAGVRIQLGIKRPFNGPVVRQAQLDPFGIIKAGLLGAFGLAFQETPAVVEADALLV